MIVKRPTREIKYLTQEQVRALFAAARERSVRDQLAIAFLYKFGMRASELCGLRAAAVDVKRGEVRIRGLKNGLDRVYSLPRDLRPLLRRHRPSGEYFFASRQGDGGMARTRLHQIVKETMRAAKLPEWATTHTLRHSAAVHALDAGLQPEDVRDLLRHRRLDSTMEYAALSTRRRGDYLRRLEESSAMVKVRP